MINIYKPTWRVIAKNKKGKTEWATYARSVTQEGACRAVREQKHITLKVTLSAVMVNANDSYISWNDWLAYILKKHGQTAVDTLNEARKTANNKNGVTQ